MDDIAIQKTIDVLVETFTNKNTLFTCGNGGSFADAQHICTELLKSFKIQRTHSHKIGGDPIYPPNVQAFPAVALGSNQAFLTAMANDVGYDYAFAQELIALSKKGDCLLAISTSGNSKSVCNAAEFAHARGLKVIALTGRADCSLHKFADIIIRAEQRDTARIQEVHEPIYHYICEKVEAHFFGGNK